jgi:curved DNA-binding protein CbpA
VLGVSATATPDEINSAHRKLAHTHHPDKGGRFEDMARINEARDLALKRRTT